MKPQESQDTEIIDVCSSDESASTKNTSLRDLLLEAKHQKPVRHAQAHAPINGIIKLECAIAAHALLHMQSKQEPCDANESKISCAPAEKIVPIKLREKKVLDTHNKCTLTKRKKSSTR